MKIIIGVRFRQAGKIYYFDPGKEKENITRGTRVIVETAKGVEMGTVVLPPTEMPEEKIVAPLKGIVRLATKEDEEHEQKNREKEAEAFVICKQKIDKHKLEMKLIAAEYTFDRNKLLFYFTATEELISVNWSKIWHRCSVHVLNCVRSEFVMRQNCAEESVSAEGHSAVTLIFPNLRRFPSKWQKSRICHSIRRRFRECVAV